MPERFQVVFGTQVPQDAAGLENAATVCNPHALPPSLQAFQAAGQASGWLECRTSEGALVGLWPMAQQRPPPGLRILQAPPVPRFDLAGAPLVAASHAAPALRAMLEALKAGLSPCRVISVRNLQAEGAVWDGLFAMQQEGLISLAVLESWDRALLDRAAAPQSEAYLAASLSSGSRKRLRAKRRALEEQAPLVLDIHTQSNAVAAGFERFMTLEAAGWKGRAGTALRQNEGDARYVGGVLRAMAGARRGFVMELRRGEACLASGLFLRCGREAFFWKTTYDETLAKESPGVIFDMMITDWLYQQPWFERLDTGSDDSVDPAGLIWKQRRKMANVVISLDPQGLRGKTVVASQRLRKWAKGLRQRFARR